MAERMGLDRDIAMIEMTGARYHADQITTARALPALERAKRNGLQITAGVGEHHLTLNELDVADYRTFFKLKPPLRGEDDRLAVVQAVAEGLIAEGRPGSLINITSQMAHVGGIDRAVYCGTKHAVEGFTKAFAIEWGVHGIRVNTIAPTFIRTALTEVTFKNPERVAWIEEKIKLGRIGEVEDMMGPVVFLASDAAALSTGTSMLVDGGWTAD